MQNLNNGHEHRQVCDSIAAFAAELVRMPSRAGEDSIAATVQRVRSWLCERRLPVEVLTREGTIVGLYSWVAAPAEGRSLCLDACLDTAPFGDESSWEMTPTSGTIRGGRLYGRGAADSKIAVSLFCHLAADLAREGAIRRGSLYLLFDADEHTGGFAGIKSFLARERAHPDAVIVGYPGNYGVVFGARGFLRVRMSVFGISEHSGSKRAARANAVVRAARLVELINTTELPKESDEWFRFGARVTVTALHGGDSFSQVPDQCKCNVDIRLTPSFDQGAACRWLESAAAELDRAAPDVRPTEIVAEESWPAYRLREDEPIVRILRDTASEVFNRPIKPVVCGPSNIGNYLASKGVTAICGFGASYENIHAADESVDLQSLPMVYEAYRRTVLRYLSEY